MNLVGIVEIRSKAHDDGPAVASAIGDLARQGTVEVFDAKLTVELIGVELEFVFDIGDELNVINLGRAWCKI